MSTSFWSRFRPATHYDGTWSTLKQDPAHAEIREDPLPEFDPEQNEAVDCTWHQFIDPARMPDESALEAAFAAASTPENRAQLLVCQLRDRIDAHDAEIAAVRTEMAADRLIVHWMVVLAAMAVVLVVAGK